MNNRFLSLIFVVTAAVAVSPQIVAQNTPQPRTDGKPDFTGLWAPPPAPPRTATEPSRFQGGNAPRRPTRREQGLAEIPLAEWGREAFLYYTAADGAYGGETGGASDPRYHAGTCGGPRSPADLSNTFLMYHTPQVLMITSVPDGVGTFNLWQRRIWIGKQHPSDLTEYVPFWMGHSVGRWEGDTLVVDTVRITAGTLIDTRRAIPHSGNLRMTERFSFDSNGNLQIQRTFDDPVAFTKPWTDSMNLVRQTDWDDQQLNWEVAETQQPCDPKGGYIRIDDPWFDNYDKLKKEILPDQERLDRGLPPVPEEFRQR